MDDSGEWVPIGFCRSQMLGSVGAAEQGEITVIWGCTYSVTG